MCIMWANELSGYSAVSTSPSEPSPQLSSSTDSTSPRRNPARSHGSPTSSNTTFPRDRSLSSAMPSGPSLWKRPLRTVTCSRARAPANLLT